MIDSNSDQNAIIGDLASLPFSCFCIDAPTIDPSVKTSEEVLNQNQIFVRFKFWYLFSRISDSDDHQTNIKIRKKYSSEQILKSHGRQCSTNFDVYVLRVQL